MMYNLNDINSIYLIESDYLDFIRVGDQFVITLSDIGFANGKTIGTELEFIKCDITTSNDNYLFYTTLNITARNPKMTIDNLNGSYNKKRYSFIMNLKNGEWICFRDCLIDLDLNWDDEGVVSMNATSVSKGDDNIKLSNKVWNQNTLEYSSILQFLNSIIIRKCESYFVYNFNKMVIYSSRVGIDLLRKYNIQRDKSIKDILFGTTTTDVRRGSYRISDFTGWDEIVNNGVLNFNRIEYSVETLRYNKYKHILKFKSSTLPQSLRWIQKNDENSIGAQGSNQYSLVLIGPSGFVVIDQFKLYYIKNNLDYEITIQSENDNLDFFNNSDPNLDNLLTI